MRHANSFPLTRLQMCDVAEATPNTRILTMKTIENCFVKFLAIASANSVCDAELEWKIQAKWQWGVGDWDSWPGGINNWPTTQLKWNIIFEARTWKMHGRWPEMFIKPICPRLNVCVHKENFAAIFTPIVVSKTGPSDFWRDWFGVDRKIMYFHL